MSAFGRGDSVSLQNGSTSADNENFTNEQQEATVKKEAADDLFGGVDVNVKTKCGEIFGTHDGGLTLICAFCNEEFKTLNLFGDHIQKNHKCQMVWTQFDAEMHTVEVSPFPTKVEPEEYISGKEEHIETVNTAEDDTLKRKDMTENRFNCNMCHQHFKSRSGLNRHQTNRRCASQLQPENVKNDPVKDKSGVLMRDINCSNDETNVLFLSSDSNDTGSDNRAINSQDESDSGSQDTDDESFRISDSENEAATGRFSCDICQRTFKYKHSLTRHKQHPLACSIPSSLFCVPCNRQLGCRRTFKRHQNRHALEDNIKHKKENDEKNETTEFYCEICNTYFKTKHMLQIHSDVHDKLPAALLDNLEFLKCKYCNKQFEKFAKRKQCEGTHSGTRPYECAYCKKGFLSNYDRKVHIRIHTGENVFQCPHCPKVCTNSTDMKRHVERHSNVRRFGCDLCEKRFYRRFEMTRHMRTHTKERPYVCEDCGATYPVLAQLKDHQLRHTGVKNIKCEICGRLFYSRSVLKVHMPTHFDEKPFECDVCGRKFSRVKALQKHQKLHSGIKKYVCNICGKAYAQDSGLYAHKKSHGVNIA